MKTTGPIISSLKKFVRLTVEMFLGLIQAAVAIGLQFALILLAFTVAVCLVWVVWHFGNIGLDRLHAIPATGQPWPDLALVYARWAIYLGDTAAVLLAIAILLTTVASLSSLDINRLFRTL